MDSVPPTRFVVGIDLGTTNSALAFVDTAAGLDAPVQTLPVPQVAAPGEVESRDTLPSFHYEPAPGQFDADALRLPWNAPGDAPAPFVVGLLARERGADQPGRLIVSAKSWLSHTGVDRTADLLPWHGAPDVQKLPPAEVSARYLAHLRAAWDARWPDHPLAAQEVVVTIPASFDEIARELTATAARRAGLGRVVLLEEPQAAFYAWMGGRKSEVGSRNAEAGKAKGRAESARHRPEGVITQKVEGQRSTPKPAFAPPLPYSDFPLPTSAFLPRSDFPLPTLILVCDIGGGTTDLTLIEARPAGFHRVAVGEHLILGGDNLDLALAHHVEERLGAKLEGRAWGVLIRRCQQAKETLLSDDAPAALTLSLPPATGARLIGGARQVELDRDAVRALLVDGFLPSVGPEERPARRGHASGFQEFGLPYAPDPGITRYLAAFLAAHGPGNGALARPDAVLFNGGFFESPVLRARLLEVLASWFGGQAPRVLENARRDLAVAHGAARFGLARRGVGARIGGGLARAYYLGVQDDAGQPKAMCLAPAGLEEGAEMTVAERAFTLRIRQPAEFPLYVSSTRTGDRPGEVIDPDPTQLTALPPLRTALRGKPGAEGDGTVSVTLHARLSEIGTLEVWCAEAGGRGREWRLPFDVRAAAPDDLPIDLADVPTITVEEETIRQGRGILRAVFTTGDAGAVESLVKRLESETGVVRWEWPPSLLRALWEETLDAEPARARSAVHEARWLNLLGFCLRPGYGYPVDDWRVAQTWRLFEQKITHGRNELCRAEWWILWRRVAGGLNAGQQRALAAPVLADWRKGHARVGSHEAAEVWRLLGSLERLDSAAKEELGGMALVQLADAGGTTSGLRRALVWALGRLGARVPLYGPLNTLPPAETVEAWLERLTLHRPIPDEDTAFAAAQMARRTGDRFRDVSDATRARVVTWLECAPSVPAHLVELVRTGGELQAEERNEAFGESLPYGLQLRAG